MSLCGNDCRGKNELFSSGKDMNKVKRIPRFKNEDEEREFWAAHDSTDFVDWDVAEEQSSPNLKRSTPGNSQTEVTEKTT